MGDLFRLRVVRAPETPDSVVTVAVPNVGTNLREELAQARQQNLTAKKPPQEEMWAIADAFARSSKFAADATKLPRYQQIAAFLAALPGLPDPTTVGAVLDAVQNAFGESPQNVLEDPDLKAGETSAGDALIAARLSRAAHLAAPVRHVDFLRALALIRRAAARDAALDQQGAVAAALAAPVVLPDTIFPVDPSMIQPAAVADDWIVREHILRYELSEIATIESILKGETRKHTTQHTLSSQQTLVVSTETTTETTRDIQTTDRFDLKTEVDSTLKEDLSVKAGVNVKYDSKPWTVTANVDVAYDQSKTEATKAASEQARDVVQRATTKVTDKVSQQRTTTLIESFQDTTEHDYDNGQGSGNITGVYQWLEKVLRVQMFDLGPRQIFDLMVPEPAALLWDLRAQPQPGALTAPTAFTAKPSDLTFGTLPQYINEYGVTGIPAPPEDHVTVSEVLAGTKPEEKAKADTLSIPDGYKATKASVQTNFTAKGGSHPVVLVALGENDFNFDTGHVRQDLDLNDEEVSIPFAIDARDGNIVEFVAAISVRCDLTDAATEKWQLAAHSKIMDTYLQRVKDYQDALAAQQLSAGNTQAVSGTNPDANRLIERTELKREAIGLLAGPMYDLTTFDAIKENAQAPLDPRPDPGPARELGRIARFLEEALEWENMNYVFYPYYWGRSKTWYDRVLADDPDPLFVDFLRAGQARVVVPVRPGFEADMQVFVESGGQVWGGAPLPDVHGTDYLPIAQEIRAAERPELGKPGDSWETSLPTNQMYLRSDACLPSWTVDDKWNWTPDFQPCGPSDQPPQSPGGVNVRHG
jgi:hypothetical protein